MVQARRGAETLTWLQDLTDTPENQKAEKIDALFEVKSGVEVPLDANDRGELMRLYGWTVPPINEAPSDVARRTEDVAIGDERFRCSIESGAFGTKRFEFATCPDFPEGAPGGKEFVWTNGPASITADDGSVVWERTIVSVTHPQG